MESNILFRRRKLSHVLYPFVWDVADALRCLAARMAIRVCGVGVGSPSGPDNTPVCLGPPSSGSGRGVQLWPTKVVKSRWRLGDRCLAPDPSGHAACRIGGIGSCSRAFLDSAGRITVNAWLFRSSVVVGRRGCHLVESQQSLADGTLIILSALYTPSRTRSKRRDLRGGEPPADRRLRIRLDLESDVWCAYILERRIRVCGSARAFHRLRPVGLAAY